MFFVRGMSSTLSVYPRDFIEPIHSPSKTKPSSISYSNFPFCTLTIGQFHEITDVTFSYIFAS